VPKFVKKFAELGGAIEDAVKDYAAEVRARQFPAKEHVYAMAKPIAETPRVTKMSKRKPS